MTGRSRALLTAVMAIAAGCGGDRSGSDRSADSPETRRLAGAWTVRLHVDRLRFETVAPGDALLREASGDVALVVNRWLAGDPQRPRPALYGTYDIDFRPLGFDPLITSGVPRVEASPRGRDSVDIVFEPEDDRQRVSMRGAWTADSIVGRWELDGDRIGADAKGSFVMRGTSPHQPLRSHSPDRP